MYLPNSRQHCMWSQWPDKFLCTCTSTACVRTTSNILAFEGGGGWWHATSTHLHSKPSFRVRAWCIVWGRRWSRSYSNTFSPFHVGIALAAKLTALRWLELGKKCGCQKRRPTWCQKNMTATEIGGKAWPVLEEQNNVQLFPPIILVPFQEYLLVAFGNSECRSEVPFRWML